MGLTGYYQRPTLQGHNLIFVFEDDLWLRDLSTSKAEAHRLTANPGRASDPQLSPCGKFLAYTSLDEGSPEIYVTSLEEMEPRRLTYLGDDTRCVGWNRDGSKILFTTNAGCPFNRIFQLAQVSPQGGPAESLGYGPAAHLSFAPKQGQVLGRHTWDPARWKRYRGGTAGQLWIDPKENGKFHQLLTIDGNLTRPLWVADRIYFGSDHEGICNLYSCRPDGKDLKTHTHHRDFYIRYPNSDGKRLVYQCGGDIFLLEPGKKAKKIDIVVQTQRKGLARRFVPSARYLQSYSFTHDASGVALVCRGKPYSFSLWEGAVTQHGIQDGVRYRRLASSPFGLFCVNDQTGEEEIGLLCSDDCYYPLSRSFDSGRILNLGLSPCGSRLWFSNHRHQLFCLELNKEFQKWLSQKSKAKTKTPQPPEVEIVHVCTDPFERITEASWSPDSQWLAYAKSVNRQDSRIYLWGFEDQEERAVTNSPFRDFSPDFDPDGRYLYFLSSRDFEPAKDDLFFEYSFIKATRPYLISLQQDQPDPFLDYPRAVGEDQADFPCPYLPDPDAEENKSDDKAKKKNKKSNETRKIKIDWEGIEHRLRVFPVSAARYYGLMAGSDKVFLGRSPVTIISNNDDNTPESSLECFEIKGASLSTVASSVLGFDMSLDRKSLIYRTESGLRVFKVAKFSLGSSRECSRNTGWLDLSRVKVSVKPRLEWQQMLREAWRLMRDHFWDENMASVDWQKVLERYLPLLDRLSSRREFSDLLWEFQGELGTSHAYEYGGDYSAGPYYAQGKLAATLAWSPKFKAYEIKELATGDLRSERETSPLRLFHHPLEPGDLILAVNGHPLSLAEPCEKFLVNMADQRVRLKVLRRRSHRGSGKAKPEEIEILTLRREAPVRYRSWVERNKALVHQWSEGKLGYLHIPNMGAEGFAEFHRSYYSEIEKEGLIIDVRYNGGGNVSGLLLEKLSRRRLGFDVQRWGPPIPYPQETPAGPLVAITNEQAGSDGDIFSHCFKILKLGPLIGKRTWGGTIGIWPRHPLVDGTVTTQPEFAFWFPDVGWGVENYGTDPDLEVEIRPQDWSQNKDTQLETAVKVALEEIDKFQGLRPEHIKEKPKLKTEVD